MKLTNKNNLPEPFYLAQLKAEKNYSDSLKDTKLSVTKLTKPPLMVRLEKEYFDKIEVDISDRLWILQGNIVHKILEDAASKEDLTELRVFADIGGWLISGQADHFAVVIKEGILTDYKYGSVWTFKDGVKKEYRAQVNCLSYLFELNGYKVDKLQICAMFRDWSKSKVKGHYPEKAITVYDVEKQANDVILKYMKERVKLHQEAYTKDLKDVTPCTQEERWDGRRCHAYCDVAKWCPFKDKTDDN